MANDSVVFECLLPVVSQGDGAFLGAARISLTGERVRALRDRVGVIRARDFGSVVVRDTIFEPLAWYSPTDLPPDVSAELEIEVDASLGWTESIRPHRLPADLPIPEAPEYGCARGGLEGLPHVRAAEMIVRGNGFYWQASGGRGDGSPEILLCTTSLQVQEVPVCCGRTEPD